MTTGYTYDELGNLARSGAQDFLNEVIFTGSVSDTASGLQYMNARFYNPNTGRFLSQETCSGNDSINYSLGGCWCSCISWNCLKHVGA